MFKVESKKLLFSAFILVIMLTTLSGCGQTQQNNSQNNGQNNVGGDDVQGLRPIDATDHVFGQLNAPVQIIVYSDFECPFCAQFAENIKKVEENFKDKVAIAFRHFPLASHSEALSSALSSECAAEQGKFWEMHDKLFADNKAGRLGAEQYKKDASDLGLDLAKFNQCFDSGKYNNKVSEMMAGAEKAGVSGTPTSFINGNIYPGAYPFEDFTAPNGDKEEGLESIINKLLK